MSRPAEARQTGLRSAFARLGAWRTVSWPSLYEALYFGYLAYTTTAVVLRIDVDNLGVVWLSGLALLALPIRREDWRDYRPVVLAGLTAAFYLAIQLWLFQESPRHARVQVFFSWPLLALVIQRCLRQRGFLQRLALMMFGLLLLLWPAAALEEGSSGVLRLQFPDTPLGNPNDLGAWAGFCVLVFWLWGLQQAAGWRRVLVWAAAVLALGILAESVSRSALLGLVLAAALSLRRLPPRRWLPAVLLAAALVGLGGLVLPFGIAARDYADRMFDETGRLLTWPLVLQALVERPLTGYGVEQAMVWIEAKGKYHTPHNGVLFIALASGLLPALLFVALWLAAAYNAVRRARISRPDELDALPLLAYAAILMLLSNFYFVMPWAIAVVGYCFMRPRPAEVEGA